MAYNALDVADFVVNFCNDIQRPISNLKLQKILYYIQGNSLKKTGKPIFEEEFYAWQHGPVIPPVYRKYRKYLASNIKKQKSLTHEEFDEKSKNLIIKTTIDNISYDAWELVEKTHQEDPWKYSYEIYGRNSIIPVESIRNYFCRK